MRRVVRCAVLAVALIWTASPASAQGWGRGWFEKLSGPGPFYGDDWRFTIGCLTDRTPSGESGPSETSTFQPLWSVRARGNATACFDVEFSEYANNQSERPQQGLVTFSRRQVVMMWDVPKLDGAVELGAGFGNATFRGDAYDFSRVFLPIRAELKPLRLVDNFRRRNTTGNQGSRGRNGYTGILRVVYTGLILPEALTNTDFGITTYEFNDNYLQPQYGITLMVDLSSVIFRR